MFRKMRRIKQEMTYDECADVLERRSCGVLAVLGDNGYPYAVPVSYIYDNGKILFHSAKCGHKIDAVTKYDKVSFCVVDRDDVKPNEYTTNFRSVIVFGRIRIICDDAEKREAAEKLAIKYSPDDSCDNRSKFIENWWDGFCILEMAVEHLSGKESLELKRGFSVFL